MNANADVVVVPDHFFINVRATAADQPSYGSNTGGLATQQSTPFLSNNSSNQTASLSVSPYYQQRFGGWGTLQVGYSLAHTFQDSGSNGVATQQTNGLQGYGSTGSLTSHSEYVNFTTGENFNRYQYSFSASTSQYTGGSALYQGSGNYTLSNNLSYAVTRGIALVGTVGYQTVSYGGASSFRSDYVNWTVGTHLTPNADSSLTISYGDSQGSSTWQFNGNYAPTARLSFYGSYNTSITTYLQQQQALLQTTTVGPNGVLIDRTTGAPVSATNPFGVQNSPSRVEQLSVGASYLLNRETFSTSIARYKTTTLTNSSTATGTTLPVGTSGNGTTGTFNWQHDLSPVTNLTTSVSYGVTDNGAFLGSPGTSQRTFSAGANLFRTFTDSLSGNVSYSYNERTGATGTTIQGAGNASQNLFLIGLRKIF